MDRTTPPSATIEGTSALARWGLPSLVIIIAILWLYFTPGGLLGKADAVGYAVCHRIDLRSFQLGVRTLPLCSRCTGMYLGALVTLIALAVSRGRSGGFPARPIQLVLIGFAALWALDGLNSMLSILPGAPTLYEPQNWLRLVTGTLIGISMAVMIYPVFQQAAWKDWTPDPVIPGWRWLLGLLGILALTILGVLSGNPLIQYPLAIMSSFGVLALLTTAYSVLTISIFRRHNSATNWGALWPSLLGGLALALLQVGAIDLLRYAFTGTWDGFHL